MAYEGYVDTASPTEIHGWVYDSAAPDDPVEVEIMRDGEQVATLLADKFRRDLAANNKGNGKHAFGFALVGDRKSASALTARVAKRKWELPSSKPAVKPPFPIRFDRHLAHTLEFGLPRVECAFSEAAPASDELQIVERVISAYHRALEDNPQPDGNKRDLWNEVGSAHHKEIIELLQQRNVAGTAEYLRNAPARGITYGITQGDEATRHLRTNDEVRRLVGTLHMDALASLAEFLGLLDLENPEQGPRWGENLHVEPQSLVESISAAVGFPIVGPPVMNLSFGIKSGDSVLTWRDAAALYAAQRLKAIAAERGIATPVICEIGGGLGGTAYYAHRMGAKQYTIVDLPLIGVLQGYFLLRCLPGADIQLYGEEEKSPAIRLVPTYMFHDPRWKYDLLFNQDSIPEMHLDYSTDYLRQARNNVGLGFLSINQEAQAFQTGQVRQTVVRDIVRQVGGYKQVYRFRHWLRAGYAEELYELNGHAKE